MIRKIAFTMYPVKDMKRARQFYEGTLGLKMTEDFRGEWIEYDLAGGCFAITNMLGDDVTAFTNKLKKDGVPVKFGPIDTPVCRMSVVTDPDGNSVTLHQVTC